jgi:hypothetical protein
MRNSSREREVILLVVRGTGKDKKGKGGDIEWSSNFDVGADTTAYKNMTGTHSLWKNKQNHKGFEVAANKLLELYNDYLDRHDLKNKKKSILITGHSRGAGIANILGAHFEDDSSYRSFTYTFAAPYTTTSKNYNKYTSVFNIANKDDIVPLLPLEAWGFHKYGIMKQISVANDGLEHNGFISSAKEGTFEWLIGEDYDNDGGTDRTIDCFKEVVSNRNRIYTYDSKDGKKDLKKFGSQLDADKYRAKIKKEYSQYKLDKFCELKTETRGRLLLSNQYVVVRTITPAFFMQDLANLAGEVYGNDKLLEYIGIGMINKYSKAKFSFAATSGQIPGIGEGGLQVGGMTHPHMAPTYYLIAKYGF